MFQPVVGVIPRPFSLSEGQRQSSNRFPTKAILKRKPWLVRWLHRPEAKKSRMPDNIGDLLFNGFRVSD
jgi:hypothetical protein